MASVTVAKWAEQLGVSRQEAYVAVGPRAARVRRYLAPLELGVIPEL